MVENKKFMEIMTMMRMKSIVGWYTWNKNAPEPPKYLLLKAILPVLNLDSQSVKKCRKGKYTVTSMSFGALKKNAV